MSIYLIILILLIIMKYYHIFILNEIIFLLEKSNILKEVVHYFEREY